MPTYVAAEISIHDPKMYERYKELAAPSIGKYGGRYAVRGGKTESLEGDWNPERFVILEFPDVAAARRWWSSPEYTEAKNIRHACASSRLLLIDGPSLDFDARG